MHYHAKRHECDNPTARWCQIFSVCLFCIRLTEFQKLLYMERSEQNELFPSYCHQLLTAVSCQRGANALDFTHIQFVRDNATAVRRFDLKRCCLNHENLVGFFSPLSVFPLLIIEYNEVEWWIIWFVLIASVTLVVFSALLVWAKWQMLWVRSEWFSVTSNHAVVFQALPPFICRD